jgi:predicted nucleic acid-binding protein
VDKLFLDTNILVYTVDKFDKNKHQAARNVVKEAVSNDAAVLSTQVLQEFYNACTLKLHMKPLKVKGYVHNYIENIEIVQNDSAIIERGIDISIISKISFWDALLIAAAESANCAELLTEDLNDGQTINGIKIRNPLRTNPGSITTKELMV